MPLWNCECTRWFKYDRDDLCVNKSQFVPVIFEPPCIWWMCTDVSDESTDCIFRVNYTGPRSKRYLVGHCDDNFKSHQYPSVLSSPARVAARYLSGSHLEIPAVTSIWLFWWLLDSTEQRQMRGWK